MSRCWSPVITLGPGPAPVDQRVPGTVTSSRAEAEGFGVRTGRELDSDDRTARVAVRGGDPAPVRPYDRRDDGQAQTRPPTVPRAPGVGPLEALESGREEVGGEARSVVLHGDAHRLLW